MGVVCTFLYGPVCTEGRTHRSSSSAAARPVHAVPTEKQTGAPLPGFPRARQRAAAARAAFRSADTRWGRETEFYRSRVRSASLRVQHWGAAPLELLRYPPASPRGAQHPSRGRAALAFWCAALRPAHSISCPTPQKLVLQQSQPPTDCTGSPPSHRQIVADVG